MTRESATPDVTERLGYLLKHAQLAFTEIQRPILGKHGIDGRRLAVLTVLDGPEPLSQQDAATRLGIDRTTMVGLVDALAREGFATRVPHPADRRKNAVELTPKGRKALRDGSRAGERAEEDFLAPLPPAERERFRHMLRVLAIRSE